MRTPTTAVLTAATLTVAALATGTGPAAATAQVSAKDRSTPGISGTWHFARSASTWKVSGIDADYFRSLLAKAFGPTYKPSSPGDPFATKSYRSCGLAGLLHRSDKALLTVIYQLQS